MPTDALDARITALLGSTTLTHIHHLKVRLMRAVDELQQIEALCRLNSEYESHASQFSNYEPQPVAMDLTNLSSLRKLLKHTPSLTHLELEVPSASSRYNLAMLVTVLEFTSDSDTLLPHLEHLCIHNPPEYEAGLDALIQMLHSRSADYPSPIGLQSFTVNLPTRTSMSMCPYTSLVAVGVTVTTVGYGSWGTSEGR